MWPYGQQPTRLLCQRDSLGKNTGVGCHFLLQVCSCSGAYMPERGVIILSQWLYKYGPWTRITWELVRKAHSRTPPQTYLNGLNCVLLKFTCWSPNSSACRMWLYLEMGFPGGASGKEPPSAGDVRDAGSIPGLGRSPGGGHGSLLQYSCLENPMDRGAWWATVHEVTKNQTRLRDFTFTF